MLRLRFSFGGMTWLILFIQFTAFFTFFMFVPFLSVYFNEAAGFSVGFVGLILAVRMISQQGLMMVGGFLADLLGYKRIACFGLLIRGVGFGAMGWTTDPFLILVAAVLSGWGGALFSPALKAYLTSIHPPERHRDVFSLLNMVENSGTVLGPVAGMFFGKDRFVELCMLSGGLFWLIGWMVWFLPETTGMRAQVTWRGESSRILRNRPFLLLTVGMMPFHFIYQQLYLTFPIAAEETTGTSGWIFPWITLLILLLQWPVSRLINGRRTRDLFVVAYGLLCIAFLPLGGGIRFGTVLLALTGISIGSMLLLPAFHSYVARVAPEESRASYFGFSNLAMAVGGSLGNLLGGILYDTFTRNHVPGLFWIGLGMLAFLPAAGAMGYRGGQEGNRRHLTCRGGSH